MQEEYIVPESIVEEIELNEQPNEENVENTIWNSLSPLEKIRIASRQHGVEIKQPDTSCRHCYGKGYISTKSIGSGDETELELPVPCRCILNKDDIPKMFTGLKNVGRQEKRHLVSEEQKKKIQKLKNELDSIRSEKNKIKKSIKKKMKKKFNKK